MLHIFLVALLTMFSCPEAAAEVMDKEPTLPEIWNAAGCATIVALVTARIHPLLGAICTIPLMGKALSALSAVHDTFVGPAIYREAGQSYINQVHLANALVFCSYVSAVSLWILARKNRPVVQTRQ